jgi:hypothetical protein
VLVQTLMHWPATLTRNSPSAGVQKMLDFARGPRLRLIALIVGLAALAVYSVGGGGVPVAPIAAASVASPTSATADRAKHPTSTTTAASSASSTTGDAIGLAARPATGTAFVKAGKAASGSTVIAAKSSVGRPMVAPLTQLYFEPNVGQIDGRVRYFARTPNYTLFLTKHAAVFSLVRRDPRVDSWRPAKGDVPAVQRNAAANHSGEVAAAVKIGFSGSNGQPGVSGINPMRGRVNYLIGNDPSKWHTDVPTYARVLYHSLYPGVDMVYYGTPNALEFDLRLAPGADPKAIHMAIDGARMVKIDAGGDLLLPTAAGSITLRKPSISEELAGGHSKPLDGHFVVLAETRSKGSKTGITNIGFAVAEHDSSHAIVIDPQFVYSSYLGGGGQNVGGLASLPIYANVQKYITVSDVGLDVAAISDSTAFITGLAYSTNFPTTPGALQGSDNGAANQTPNAFVAKFDTSKNGSPSLVYSTYIGGSGVAKTKGIDGDQGAAIAADSSGDAYVAGVTYSTNFPTKNVLPGGNVKDGTSALPKPVSNGFALELNPSGNSLLYSTYIHGAKGVVPTRIALDPGCSTECKVYIVGGTRSAATTGTGKKAAADFPITAASAFQAKNPDKTANSAAFLLVLNGYTGGGSLSVAYGTFLGGAGITAGGDSATGLAVDGNGKAYLDGVTFSKNFPTKNAFQSVNNGAGLSNGFVSVIDPSQSGANSLVWSTYLGGKGNKKAKEGDLATALALDSSNDVWTTGLTYSYNANPPGFPTKTPFQADNNANPATYTAADIPAVGASNFFVTEFSSLGSLKYSTYVGGGGINLYPPPITIEIGDAGTGIKVDSNNRVWVTGAVSSRTGTAPFVAFPAPSGGTLGCFQNDNTFSGGPFGVGPLAAVVVFNLDPAGNTIPFLTFAGGEALDVPSALAIDASNHLYVTGLTYSSEYPITSGTYQATNAAAGNGKGPSFLLYKGIGTTNAFLSELDPTSGDCGNIIESLNSPEVVGPAVESRVNSWKP